MIVDMVRIHDRVWQLHAPYGPSSKLVHTRLVLLYLVQGSKLALVDAGPKHAPAEVVRPALNSLGFDLPDVSYILITHGHHDHVGGNGNFKREAPNVQICVPGLDRQLAESHERHGEHIADLLHQFGRSDLLPARLKSLTYTLGPFGSVDRILGDGDRIDLGDGVELTVIHTPGHSPGSSSFYWESEKLLISGDAVQGRGSFAGSWPYYNDAVAYRRSIDRLLDLPIETLCLSHPSTCGQPLNTPVKRGADVRDILKDSANVAEVIDEVVRARLAATPQASDLEIAQGVTLDLLDTIPTMIDPVLKIPSGGAGTLAAHLREVRAEALSGAR